MSLVFGGVLTQGSNREDELRETLMDNQELDERTEYYTPPMTDPEGDDNSSDIPVEVQRKGCIAFLERLPLWSKLALITLVSLVGLFGLSGLILYLSSSDISSKRQIVNFIQGSKSIQRVINAIKNERQNTVYWLTYRYDEDWDILKSSRKTTDKVFDEYSGTDNVDEIVRNTVTLRQRIDSNAVNTPRALEQYGDFIDQLKMFVSTHAKEASLTDNSMPILLVATELVETVNRLRAFGDYLFGVNFADSEIEKSFADYQSKYQQFATLFGSMNSGTFDYDTFVKSTTSQNITIGDTMDNIVKLFNSASGGKVETNGTLADQFANNMTEWQKGMNSLGSRTIAKLEEFAEEKKNLAILFLALSSSFAVALFVLGFILQIILVRTITGPWRRINKLQEETVRKFVPKGFIRLLNCNSISDLKLGKHVERRVGMLLVEIQDFEKLTKGMTPKEILFLLNEYLNYICPVVRRHDGFVDRYNYNGFTALFKNRSQAVSAALDIQHGTSVFNTTRVSFPDLDVLSTVHGSHVMIAAVGEDERMDGVVCSPEARLNIEMERIGTSLGAGILATIDSMPMSRNLFSGENVPKLENCRDLGIIESQVRQVRVYEVFDTNDQRKLTTKDSFEKATKLLSEHEYYGARVLLQMISSRNAADIVADRLNKKCDQVIAECEDKLERMEMDEMLSTEPIRDAFEEHCRREISLENLDVWKLIQAFKEIHGEDERRKQAEKIYKDWSDQVNITDLTKRGITRKLEDPKATISKDFFFDLQREMKLNMSDTFKRFKTTDLGRKTYMKEMTKNRSTNL